MLNATLTSDELLDALALSPPGKAPGADGLPPEVYKRYTEVLLPHLKSVYSDSLELE